MVNFGTLLISYELTTEFDYTYHLTGEYDPAEIHNAGMIRRHMLQVCGHLAWQMVSFFIYLYCLLDSVMSEDVLMPLDDDVTVLNKPADTKYYTYPPPHDHHPQADGHRDYDF